MLGAILLVLTVIGIGVLHTLVPDHWLPIAVLARQRGWTSGETARAASQAGAGHVATTLILGLAAWLVGAVAAQSYAHLVDLAASIALIGFGAWIAYGAWRELQADKATSDSGHHHHDHDHHHDHVGHSHAEPWARDALYAPLRNAAVSERHEHWHRHGAGPAHRHWHDHDPGTAHVLAVDAAALAIPHVHGHGTSGRMALLLVLGSSPMVEGIPAFFAAANYGIGLLAIMAIAFAASTIATYVVLSVYSASGLQRVNLGPLERYGEVLSGGLIVLVGLAFGLFAIF